MRLLIILFFGCFGSLYAQTIDSIHSHTSDKIKLGMNYASLKPYADNAPSVEPKTKWIDLKTGFDKKFLGFPITEVSVLFDKGEVMKIQMLFSKYEDDMVIEGILTKAFGKPFKTEGTGDMWRTLWVVGQYAIDLNGGEAVSQYYLYLMYEEDLDE